jgi:hypothetical protein
MQNRMREGRRRTLYLLLAVMAIAWRLPVRAEEINPAVSARLSERQLRIYEAYRVARLGFDQRLESYWKAVDEKREVRKRKYHASEAFVASDYVGEQPPNYNGPSLPSDIAKIIAELKPPGPETPRPSVADFLSNAKVQFAFVPSKISESEFKRRYAEEALRTGLTKAQIVRVFALETGGRGTYDMQAGIDPETKQGKPISSALGYAQLLDANSVNELVKHGPGFIQRLEAMAAMPGVSANSAIAFRAKAAILRKMLRAARSVPNEWYHHVRFGATPPGLAIHALNLDADIGPWLQTLKLKGLLQTAAAAGRDQLSGAELELMNLAGPRTGLEMMQPIGRGMPTSNFFSQGGYYRNSIVRDKTAAELLAALNERMEVNLRKPGAVEFAAAFDEIEARQRSSQSAAPPVSIEDLLKRTGQR